MQADAGRVTDPPDPRADGARAGVSSRRMRSAHLCICAAALAACGGSPSGACDDDACGTTCADSDSDCGSTTTSPTTTSSPETTMSATSADTSSTDPMPTATTVDPDDSSSTGFPNPECRDDSECDAAEPICSTGTCVPCSEAPEPDAACNSLNPDAPLCVGDACVQCDADDQTVCTGTVPICDVATNTCIGCSAHEQCPASACHFDEGSCLPDDVVFWVDGDAGDCLGADGSMALPYCTIGEAVDQIGQASRGTIRIVATGAPYGEAIEIDGNRVVALLGDGPELPAWFGIAAPTLTVDSATVFAHRIGWRSNALDPAVALDDATMWIDRSEIVLNQGGGVELVAGSVLHLRTSVIGAGGSGLADRQALRVDGSMIDVVASTIAGNDSSMMSSIRCLGGGGGSVRSSIVVGLDPPSVSCLGLEVDDSAIDTEGLGGSGNVELDAFNAGWFVDAAGGDFHLVDGTLFEDLGVWHDGDPAVDLDGDARPDRDGAPDVAGADVP